MRSWINEQLKYNIAQWDKAIELNYPQHLNAWKDPREHFRYLTEEWNLLDAVKIIDWENEVKDYNCSVLDMGGGTGWLSAHLSKIDKIDKVFLLDSNEYFLNTMLPEVTRLMGGNINKIVPIQGLFSPILLESESIDIVVASSSLHHCDNLDNTLKEVHRVLRKNGTLFILNETPHKNNTYMLLILKQFFAIVNDIIFYKYKPVSPYISSSGYLYDAYLGDKYYPLWYWQQAISNAHFALLKIVTTPYFTQKKKRTGTRLTHFVCQKISWLT